MDSRRPAAYPDCNNQEQTSGGDHEALLPFTVDTSRCVLFFVHDSGIKLDEVIVDLFSGEHVKEPFSTMNPSKMVPVLDDDGFILTESSSI